MAKLVDIDYDPFAPKQDPLEAALELEGITDERADIARSIYAQESSSGKNTKTSNAGARGGMQVIPATFNRMADKGWAIDDPVQNARAGVRYISTLYDRAGGDPALTAAGYYGGEGAIDKARRGQAVSDPRNPSAPNTLEYGEQVVSRLPQKQPQLIDVDYDPFNPQPEPKPQEMPEPEQNMLEKFADYAIGNTMGAVAGTAADIGNNLINAATYIPRKLTQAGADFYGVENPFAGVNEAREASLDDWTKENQGRSGFTVGRIGANIAGTAGVGNVLAIGANALNKFKLAQSLKTGGFSLGGAPAATKMETLTNAATRVGGAAATGTAAGGLIDPEIALEAGAVSAALPVVGKVAGTVGKIGGKVKDKAFGRKSAGVEAAKNSQVKELQDAGFSLPPQDVDAGMGSQILNAVSGKIKTEQKASVLNLPKSNAIIADDLGLNVDQPITRSALADVRKKAGEAYEVAKNYGMIKVDDVFRSDITKISEKYSSAGADFPELVGDDIGKLITSLNKETFDSASAISAIKILREKADKAYRAGDTSLGKATKDASNALEDMVGRHLEASGASKQVLENYRNARKTIAKTYTVDKALNETTGNVSPVKLGAELKKGKPLEGGIKLVAELGRSFPKSAQDLPGVNPYSVLDGAGAAFGLATNPALAAYVAARPTIRSLVLSRPYQKAFVRNKSENTIGKMLSRPRTQQAITKSAPALSNPDRK